MNIYSSNSTSTVHHFRKPVNCICCKKELSSAANLARHYDSHNHNPIQSSNLFLDNKYTKLYFKLVSKEMYEGYTEKHHIIPRSLGGDNSKENIISISARYHFLCHYLLTKMVPENTKEWRSLIKAFNMMNANSDNHPDRYMNARLFESNRKHMSETMSINSSGKNNSQHGTMWIMEISTGESIRIKKEEWNSYDKSVYKKGRSYDKDLYIDKMKNPDLYFKNGYEKRKERANLRSCMVNENLPESERYLEENLKGAKRMASTSKLAKKLGYDFNNKDIDFENLKLRNILLDLYVEKKMSIPMICKEYDANIRSVELLLIFCGIPRRSSKEMHNTK